LERLHPSKRSNISLDERLAMLQGIQPGSLNLSGSARTSGQQDPAVDLVDDVHSASTMNQYLTRMLAVSAFCSATFRL
jgi:hypothetical protein